MCSNFVDEEKINNGKWFYNITANHPETERCGHRTADKSGNQTVQQVQEEEYQRGIRGTNIQK